MTGFSVPFGIDKMPYLLSFFVFFFTLILVPGLALADADEPINAAAGLQPLVGSFSPAQPYRGESRIFQRADGAFQAIPEVHGRTKIFHFVEREAPWTLRPGLTVAAKTYNGVVPGPSIVVRQGDHVVIDLLNELHTPDTLHLHGIHGGPVEMDGVGGISQAMIPPGGHFRYEFDAIQSGTFMYHSHGSEDMIDAGLYGGIIVTPNAPRSEEAAAHDYLQIISAWKIQSLGENHFTINGKSYPATKALEISKGQRIRIRWINISSENEHTMHTHGHDQLVIARDAQPLEYRDVEDTLMLGPGQRADVIMIGSAKTGTWLIHCHVLDHVEGANAMPDGLIGALHYTGTPDVLSRMNDVMTAHAAMSEMSMKAPASQKNVPSKPKAISLGTTLLFGSVAGFTMFLGFLLVGSRRLPIETILGTEFVACTVLAFLLTRIVPNLTYYLLQGMKAWTANGPFPLLIALALLSGLIIGFIGTAAARYKKLHACGALLFAQGLAVGAAAISGATLLVFFLIVGFTIRNAVKGCDVAVRLHASGKTASTGQIIITGCLSSLPIVVGMLLGYTLAAPAFTTFFFAIATGALIYAVGESAAYIFILIIVGGKTTNAETDAQQLSPAFTSGGLR